MKSAYTLDWQIAITTRATDSFPTDQNLHRKILTLGNHKGKISTEYQRWFKLQKSGYTILLADLVWQFFLILLKLLFKQLIAAVKRIVIEI